MRGEGVEAEDLVAEGDQPIRKWRFFEVPDAVHVQGHEIMVRDHIARRLRVGGVGVIEQGGGEERTEVDRDPEEEQPCPLAKEALSKPVECVVPTLRANNAHRMGHLMTCLSFLKRGRHHYFCSGTNWSGSFDPSPKKNWLSCSTRNSCASFFQGWRRYSLSSIFWCSSHSFHARWRRGHRSSAREGSRREARRGLPSRSYSGRIGPCGAFGCDHLINRISQSSVRFDGRRRILVRGAQGEGHVRRVVGDADAGRRDRAG